MRANENMCARATRLFHPLLPHTHEYTTRAYIAGHTGTEHIVSVKMLFLIHMAIEFRNKRDECGWDGNILKHEKQASSEDIFGPLLAPTFLYRCLLVCMYFKHECISVCVCLYIDMIQVNVFSQCVQTTDLLNAKNTSFDYAHAMIDTRWVWRMCMRFVFAYVFKWTSPIWVHFVSICVIIRGHRSQRSHPDNSCDLWYICR